MCATKTAKIHSVCLVYIVSNTFGKCYFIFFPPHKNYSIGPQTEELNLVKIDPLLVLQNHKSTKNAKSCLFFLSRSSFCQAYYTHKALGPLGDPERALDSRLLAPKILPKQHILL